MAWYDLDLKADGGTWLVSSRAFPELATFGATRDDALARARQALEEAIAGRMADGEDIPYARLERPEGDAIEVPLLVLLKAGLYMRMRQENRTRADLMRSLGWHREQVDRLFRLDHNSRIDQLEDAYKALGHPLRFDMAGQVLDAA